MALLTLQQLKTVLGIDPANSSQDAALLLYVNAADAAVKQFCRRDLEQQSYTEYYSGNNTPRLALRQYPVTALGTVYLDNSGYFGTRAGAFNPTLTLLTEGTDFVLDRKPGSGSTSNSGVLLRIGTVWPMLNRLATLHNLSPDLGPAWGNIQVSYTAGYATVPNDLNMAAIMLAVHLRRIALLGGLTVVKERIGDYAYELLSKPSGIDLGSVRTTLARYVEMGW